MTTLRVASFLCGEDIALPRLRCRDLAAFQHPRCLQVQKAAVKKTVGDGPSGSFAWRTRTATWVGIAAALLGLFVVTRVVRVTLSTASSWFYVSVAFTGFVLQSRAGCEPREPGEGFSRAASSHPSGL
jgi:hypothetical protein